MDQPPYYLDRIRRDAAVEAIQDVCGHAEQGTPRESSGGKLSVEDALQAIDSITAVPGVFIDFWSA
jgi:hypothetical protein